MKYILNSRVFRHDDGFYNNNNLKKNTPDCSSNLSIVNIRIVVKRNSSKIEKILRKINFVEKKNRKNENRPKISKF